MAKSSNGGGKSGYIGFAKQAAFGAAAGATIDAFCEISKFPVFNDASQLGGPNTSNAEVVLYGAGLIMTVLGLLDMIAGVPIRRRRQRIIANRRGAYHRHSLLRV